MDFLLDEFNPLALRIIMERECEIRAFVPEKYWKMLGLFETLKNPPRLVATRRREAGKN